MYDLDAATAKKADQIGQYINETGKYIGAFTRAEKLVSQAKGTHGIGFSFKADDGRECRFDIWTAKGDGEKLSGMANIHAMMACLQVRSLKDGIHRVKKWDAGTQTETMQDATCFPELMNKKIGLLLRAEEYEKMKDGNLTGETGWRMGLMACFQAATELMASEILDRKTQPEQLAKMIPHLQDRLLKTAKKATGTTRPTLHAGASMPLDDDIPF